MNTPGKLTRSGLLYEGNFPEWRTRIDSMFDILGLHQFVSNSQRCTYHDPQSEKALSIMKPQISPALLKRVPPRRHPCPCALWRSLDGLCQPFPLLDLPEETRRRIHGFVLMNTAETQPLTLVCRRLRMETAAYWMTIYHFRLDFSHDAMLSPKAFAEHVRSWALSLGRHNLKYLREAIVIFRGTGRQGLELRAGLSLCFGKDDGLWLVVDHAYPAMDSRALEAALAMLGPQVEEVEADRLVLGLQGESLVLALTSLASTWVKAYSEWQRIVKGGKCE